MNTELFERVPDYEGTKDPLDRYYTPEWVVEVLLEHIDLHGKGVLEPCVGTGNIAKVIKERFDYEFIRGIDVDKSVCGINKNADLFFTQNNYMSFAPELDFDWIITNPPYKTGDYSAADFVRKALSEATEGVAMLLWSTFLEGCDDRIDIFQYRAPSKIIMLPRFNFITPGKRFGTPSKPACWFIWDVQRPKEDRATEIIWVPKERKP